MRRVLIKIRTVSVVVMMSFLTMIGGIIMRFPTTALIHDDMPLAKRSKVSIEYLVHMWLIHVPEFICSIALSWGLVNRIQEDKKPATMDENDVVTVALSTEEVDIQETEVITDET